MSATWHACCFSPCPTRAGTGSVRSRCPSPRKTAFFGWVRCPCYPFHVSSEPRVSVGSSGSRDRHAVDAQGRGVDAVAQFRIAGRGGRGIRGQQVAAPGGFADGGGEPPL